MTFEELLKKHDDLNDEMYETVSDFVTKHGGIIRTDNREGDDFRDSISAIVFDGYDELYVEEHVLAVAVTESGLAVYTDQSYSATIKGMTDDEILSDKDDWYLVKGGEVWINPTLTSICECIEQYVD